MCVKIKYDLENKKDLIREMTLTPPLPRPYTFILHLII